MTMLGRREALNGVLAGALVALFGCGRGESRGQGTAREPAGRPAMVVHRDPGCGCCEKWAELARSAGYDVTLLDEADMDAVKASLRVPEALGSCHTAVVDGAVIEGHVPFSAIAAFLARRPLGAVGLAVPGMPVGSPGMEVAGLPPDRLVVHVFDAAGRSKVYAG